MKITVNDEQKEVSDQIAIAELLTLLSIQDPKGLAIAVNNRVVRRDNWDTHVLNEADCVILIKATKGG